VIKVLGLSLYGPLAASNRYRLSQYLHGLRQYGIDLEVMALLGNDYIQTTFLGERYSIWKLVRDYLERVTMLWSQSRYDLAILHVELLPFVPSVIESRLLKIPYIYDFDDAFFLKYRGGRFKGLSFLLGNKFEPILSMAAAVTAGNRYLCDYARRLNSNTRLMPTVVDTDRYRYAPNKRDAVFTVGWIGSPSTSVYLSEMVRPLVELAEEMPVRFVVIGGRCPMIKGVDVEQLPWSEDTEVQLINTLDVGVMPLYDDEWAKGKCGLKLIQYMACGVPVVASPVGANIDVVGPGGFLPSDAEAWRDSLRRLRDDSSLRRRMGEYGRKQVENHYSLRSTLPSMADTIKCVAGK
jgi:glycosyltransferase involved in cell wall biosynthesis